MITGLQVVKTKKKGKPQCKLFFFYINLGCFLICLFFYKNQESAANMIVYHTFLTEMR